MARVINRTKALSVSPLKASQPVGASLAFLGLSGAMPLMHGAQGCTAFAKVFFVRHFREPVPLQTTAMDQVSAVMGADPSIVLALDAICKKSSPEVIGLVSTGLSEMQGCDLRGAVKQFRVAHPEHAGVTVVAVNTPDFNGCFETGYASAVLGLIDELVPRSSGERPKSDIVNVLPSSMLTPGDLEEIEDLLLQFDLTPRFVPNLGDSLGGQLTDHEFSPITLGGTPVSDVRRMGQARATLVIGPSLRRAGELVEGRTGVPSFYFPHLHSLSLVDELVACLLDLTERTMVTPKLARQRRQLTDALLDTHFGLGQRRIAIAADPDLILAMSELAQGVGGEVVAAVAPAKGPALTQLGIDEVQIGDLQDLERLALEQQAQVIFGSSHAAETAARLELPLFRTGFPLYDTIGAAFRRWVGYRGVRDALFDLTNLLHLQALDEVPVYRARLSQKAHEPKISSHPLG